MLIAFVTAAASAILISEYFLSGRSVLLSAFAIGAAFLIYYFTTRKKESYNKHISAIFIGFIIGMILHIGYSSIIYAPAISYADQKATIIGSVASEPDRDNTRVIVRVSNIDDEKVKIPFKVILYLDEEIYAVPGDEIEVSASLKIPNVYDNFNARQHYKSRGIYLTAVADNYADITTPEKYPLWSVPLHIASDIKNQIVKIMPRKESAALVSALLLGDRSGLSREFSDAITDIGLSHVVSVSGMHVSFIANLILMIFGVTVGSFIAIPILAIFTLIAGAPAAAIRALIMQTVMLLSLIIKREPDTKISLFFALGIILLLNPFAISDVSLWLSFTSTLGLVLYSKPIMMAIMKPFDKIKNRVIQKLIALFASVISTTFAALFLSTPILIITFRTVSIVSPVSNLLLLFPFELLFFGGLIFTLVSFIFLPIGRIAGVLLGFVYKFIEKVTFFLAEFPLARYSVVSAYTISFFFCIYVIFLIYIVLKQRKKDKFDLKFRYIAAACAFCMLVTAACEWYDRSNSSYVAVLDSQGAQCTIIHDASHTVMINCGGYDSSYEASEYLESVMADKIDLLIITDYRSGSIKNVSALIENVAVDKIIMPPAGNEQEAEKLSEILNSNVNIEYIIESRTENTGMIESYIGSYDGRLFVRSQLDSLSVLAPGALSPETLGKALYEIGYPNTLIVSAGDYYSSHELPGSVHMLSPSACVLSEYYPIAGTRMDDVSEKIPTVIDGTMSGNTVFRCFRDRISFTSSQKNEDLY